MAKKYKFCTLDILEVIMKFSELLNLFKKTLPIPKNNQPEFISNLLNLFIEDSAENATRFDQFSH